MDVLAQWDVLIPELKRLAAKTTPAELDDHLMEKYLHEQEPTIQELQAAIRKGTIERKCNPVMCGAALRNIGVQMLLDGIRAFIDR